MRILVTGGTGSIGGPIVPALLRRGHEVLALARNERAHNILAGIGATPLAGDLRRPDDWAGAASDVDGVIHTAASWSEDMAATDVSVVTALLDAVRRGKSGRRFIYTGGCWLYGATGDRVATETDPYDSLPEFAWSLPLMRDVLGTPDACGMVIHPAMVYERDGGVFGPFIADAKTLGHVRVVGSTAVRWPLVHRDDLAELYVQVMEDGKAGDVFNGATVAGMPVGQIASAIAARFGADETPVVRDVRDAEKDFGSSAAGYAIDQQMSGQAAMQGLGWAPRHKDVLADIS